MAGGARRARLRARHCRGGGDVVNDFVEECRREWRRLRVPDHVADEMAAELAADLEEAASEDVSADQLLGNDPPAFAAAWAAERGFGEPRRARRGLLLLAAVLALVAVAAAGAAIAITASPAQPSSVSALPSIRFAGTDRIWLVAAGDLPPGIHRERSGPARTIGSIV